MKFHKLTILVIAAALVLVSCSRKAPYRAQRMALGTVFNITVHAFDPA